MTSLLILLGISIGVVLIVSCLFVGISYIYRRKKPLTRAMDEERKRLDAKRGVETPQATVPQRSEGNGVLETLKKHVMGNWQVFFLICVAGVALYYTYNSTASLADLSRMAHDRWMFLLAAWGVLAILVAINVPKEWQKTLQGALVAVVATLMVASPIWGAMRAYWEHPQDTAVRATGVLQHGSLPRAWNLDGSIRNVDAWIKVIVPGNGKSQSVSPLSTEHVVWGGTGFTVYCVYPDEHEEVSTGEHPCSDGLAWTYVKNNGSEPVHALYAFVERNEK